MDNVVREIIQQLGPNPGASQEALDKLQTDLGLTLPDQYVEFMQETNGAEGSIGETSYISIWPIEEIKLLNEENPVREFAPGLLLFGSDGGESAYAFDTRVAQMPVVAVPYIGLDYDEVELRGNSFDEFLKNLNE